MIWGSSDHDLDLSHSEYPSNAAAASASVSSSSMESISFRCFIEQNLGRSALFLIYSVLEFVMIVLLLVDGFLAFFSYEFAKFFELKMPCFFCTRIDQALVHRNLNFYYNDTICESHKRDISSLSYCHVHKKISDIKTMCENCLLSFAPDKDSSDYYAADDVKSVNVFADKPNFQRCSCCMEFLGGKGKYTRSMSQVAPPPSPRAWRNNETDHPDDNENATNGDGRDDNRSLAVSEEEEEEGLEDSSCKTPCNRGGNNKFVGIPLSDSPRMSTKKTRTMSIDYSALSRSDPNNYDLVTTTGFNEGNGSAGIIQHLKRQVLLERKSLVSVCMELDEERNASAIAANNAMAMITRLQAEKASKHMQASQYQRMMEEQAEYDREEKQILKDMILKREEEIEALESDLDVYRDKFGPINLACSEFFEIEGDDEFHSLKFQSLSSFGEMSCRSLTDVLDHHEVYLDSDNDRSHHSALLRTIPETTSATPAVQLPEKVCLGDHPQDDDDDDDESPPSPAAELKVCQGDPESPPSPVELPEKVCQEDDESACSTGTQNNVFLTRESNSSMKEREETDEEEEES
ncbi:PREDICTED: probable myosin-binding protein 5 isoform X2 [Ipomoea nil]|uniref:probable myosin-binding protein 5 isoform X2 n=1 Tax=Ipomoea nil TaxID=35883 RepID=UPI000901BE7E|nr:PREDICTED: probable myosin-binding protein 5 isoform X2 [Ipomoea nil]